MKTLEIIAEEGKKKGIVVLEKTIVDGYAVLEASAPRLLTEATDNLGKALGSILTLALPAFKPVIEKLADLNKDGKIG